MKLGLLTAAFPGMSLMDVAGWAGANQFETLEIACWPSGKTTRRYAGVTTIDVENLSKEGVAETKKILKDNHLEVSALAYYPNPLTPDLEARKYVINHLKKVIDASSLLMDNPIVGTFVGKDKNKTIEENVKEFSKVWPSIVAYARNRGVKIAIENCPMIFSLDEYPGGLNLANNPSTLRKLFEIIPDENFGLNFDPSHLVWQMIDISRFVKEFASKFFHVHAKDMEIDRDSLYENGVTSIGMGWQLPRLPGLGEINWSHLISDLYHAGYDFVISIEHEDRIFEGSEELVKRGFLIARNALKPYIH
jgi:sugar phosphate isomerase/epimerase